MSGMCLGACDMPCVLGKPQFVLRASTMCLGKKDGCAQHSCRLHGPCHSDSAKQCYSGQHHFDCQCKGMGEITIFLVQRLNCTKHVCWPPALMCCNLFPAPHDNAACFWSTHVARYSANLVWGLYTPFLLTLAKPVALPACMLL